MDLLYMLVSERPRDFPGPGFLKVPAEVEIFKNTTHICIYFDFGNLTVGWFRICFGYKMYVSKQTVDEQTKILNIPPALPWCRRVLEPLPRLPASRYLCLSALKYSLPSLNYTTLRYTVHNGLYLAIRPLFF